MQVFQRSVWYLAKIQQFPTAPVTPKLSRKASLRADPLARLKITFIDAFHKDLETKYNKVNTFDIFTSFFCSENREKSKIYVSLKKVKFYIFAGCTKFKFYFDDDEPLLIYIKHRMFDEKGILSKVCRETKKLITIFEKSWISDDRGRSFELWGFVALTSVHTVLSHERVGRN